MELDNIKIIQKIRKWSLQYFIIFLTLSALISIVSILFGNFGDFEIKILVTTTVIAIFSVACMGYALYAEKSGQPVPAAAGALIGLVAAVLIIIGAWAEIDSDEFWKTTAVFSVFGIAAAHYFLLASVKLKQGQHCVTTAALAVILCNALSISLAVIYETDEEFIYKIIAVLSILSALVTLIIPILYRIGKKAEEADQEEAAGKLILFQENEHIYKNEQGERYRVEKIIEGSSE